MPNTNTVIIISTHNVGLGLIRIFGESQFKIIALYYDPLDMGYVSKYVHMRFRIPHPENNSADFIAQLIKIRASCGGGLLIPADDTSQVAVAKHKSLLEKYYTVACTDWNITEKFIVKKHTYRIAAACQIPMPRFIVPQSAAEIAEFSNQIEYPCMVKPCQSHLFYDKFRIKMFKVYSFKELMDAYAKACEAGLEVMIQEYIPGEDTNGINYNSYVWDNRVIAEFTAEKVRLSPVNNGVPCVVVSKMIPQVREMGRALLAKMEYYGYSCMEFKKDDRDGIYKLMEVNGRHNRSVLLAYKCGINFPLLQYEHLVNKKLVPVPYRYPEGVFWIDILKDIAVAPVYLKKYAFNIFKWLAPYAKKKIFATFNRHDLKPMRKRIFDLFKKTIGRRGKT